MLFLQLIPCASYLNYYCSILNYFLLFSYYIPAGFRFEGSGGYRGVQSSDVFGPISHCSGGSRLGMLEGTVKVDAVGLPGSAVVSFAEVTDVGSPGVVRRCSEK